MTDTSEISPAAAEAASRLLSGFTHDLAAPLANIKLAAELVAAADGRLAPERMVALGENIGVEADRLRRMVDRLVMWYRLEASLRALRCEWHLVEEVVGSALNALGDLLDNREVVITIEPDLAMVRGDAVLLEVVLTSLLEQALHFGPPESPIEVHVRGEETRCCVEVRDRGPSLDVDQPAGSNARQGRTGPPGGELSLAVSQKIVRAHGGELRAHDRAECPGVVFTFVVGFGQHAPPPFPSGVPSDEDGTD